MLDAECRMPNDYEILWLVLENILGDPGADTGGEGKSKPAEKYIWNEEK